jgi:hypothetical protein
LTSVKREARDFRRVTPNRPIPPQNPASRSEKKSPTCLNGGVGQGAAGFIERPFWTGLKRPFLGA